MAETPDTSEPPHTIKLYQCYCMVIAVTCMCQCLTPTNNTSSAKRSVLFLFSHADRKTDDHKSDWQVVWLLSDVDSPTLILEKNMQSKALTQISCTSSWDLAQTCRHACTHRVMLTHSIYILFQNVQLRLIWVKTAHGKKTFVAIMKEFNYNYQHIPSSSCGNMLLDSWRWLKSYWCHHPSDMHLLRCERDQKLLCVRSLCFGG